MKHSGKGIFTSLVLAAGLGTRLRPLTLHKPKPLLKVLGKTLLEVVIERLKPFSNPIAVNSHYLADMLEAEAEKVAKKLNVQLLLLREDKLLDTGGTIKRVLKTLSQKGIPYQGLIVHNSDVISSFPLELLVKSFYDLEDDEQGLLLCFEPVTSLGATLYPINTVYNLRTRKLIAIGREDVEALEHTTQHRGCHFCGIYIVKPTLLNLLPDIDRFSIIETFRTHPSAFKVLPHKGFFADLGTFKGLITLPLSISPNPIRYL